MHAHFPPSIRIAYAPRDEDRMRMFAEELGRDFAVSADTRKIGHVSDHVLTIALWSRASIENWAVVEMARDALDVGMLVQVTLDGTRREDMGGHAAIDFRNPHNGSAWRNLRERIDQVSRGKSALPGAPIGGLFSVVGFSAVVISLALSHRVTDGNISQPDLADATTQTVASTPYGDIAPRPALVGGPESPQAELGLSDDFRFHRLRAPAPVRVNPIPDLPSIRTPDALAQVEIARPGIIRRMLNVAEDNIPFVGAGEETGDIR